jgi:hypothetical protein
MNDHERRIYLNHIRRLQERSRMLGEMLAQERIARQHAYRWYSKRLQSPLSIIIDVMLLHGGKIGIILLSLLHLDAHKKI